jgi:cobalt-zinc-cadmium efflux system protein
MSAGHDHHHHDHGHGGHHGHHHHHAPPADGDRRWVIGVALNGAFVLVEATAGILGHSMALLADAGHNLSDVLALAMAGAAAWLSRQPSSPRRTYGFGKATVLAALANAVILVFACGFIAREAIGRFSSPTAPASGLMIGVALSGVLVNGLTALLFTRGREHDINVRSAFLHMAADAAISAGVAIAGGLIILTGAAWIDPAASLAILVVILFGTWEVLKEAFDLAIDTAPAAVDIAAVRAFLAEWPGVSAVHDLHVWPLSTTETALTAHLVRTGGGDDQFLASVCRELKTRFHIGHATLQVEVESLEACEELHA